MYCIMGIHHLHLVEPKIEEITAEPVSEDVDPAGVSGFDICGTSEEHDIPATQGKPRMHLPLPCFYKSSLSIITALGNRN